MEDEPGWGPYDGAFREEPERGVPPPHIGRNISVWSPYPVLSMFGGLMATESPVIGHSRGYPMLKTREEVIWLLRLLCLGATTSQCSGLSPEKGQQTQSDQEIITVVVWGPQLSKGSPRQGSGDSGMEPGSAACQGSAGAPVPHLRPCTPDYVAHRVSCSLL